MEVCVMRFGQRHQKDTFILENGAVDSEKTTNIKARKDKKDTAMKLRIFLALAAPVLVASLLAISMVPATPKALINGDTVSGSPSVEEQKAVADGFSVTVVSAPSWDAMTQPQFA